MAKLLICSLALGASVFLLFSLIGGKLLHSYIRNSDYLYSMETHRIYTMTNWIRDNHISTSDTEKLNAWMDEQGLSSMTIERDGSLLFSRIAERSFSSSAASQLQSFLEEAMQHAHSVSFTDGNANVFIYEGFEWKYYIILLLTAGILGLFFALLPVFFTLKKEMDYIRLLNGRLSEIGQGNLAATIPITGINEISYLAAGIENMRVSLSETEKQKQEMKLAQQNLVLGMAHDLRTPLATLLTDLELLKRQGNKMDQLNYADRALTKTLEIRALSDQLFEYFLASADQPVELEPWESAEYALGDYLSELYLYLAQDGFQIQTGELFAKETKVRIHVEYMSRIINNIFSNIQKYADRSAPVILSTEFSNDMLIVSCKNKISPASTHSGTGIGVKNIALMMQKMNGKQEQVSEYGWYEILLYFPCQTS